MLCKLFASVEVEVCFVVNQSTNALRYKLTKLLHNEIHVGMLLYNLNPLHLSAAVTTAGHNVNLPPFHSVMETLWRCESSPPAASL